MSWMDEEPVRGGYPDPRLLALSGLDRMNAADRKQMPLPPIHHLFGLRPGSASYASVTFTMPCSPWLQTVAGPFFAGASALVADAPLTGAVLTALGPGKLAVTSDLSLNFLRPVTTQSKRLVARARSIEIGRSLGLAEGLVEDNDGRIVAHGTTRCFVTTVEHPPLEGELPLVEPLVYDTPDPYDRPIRPGAVDPEAYQAVGFFETMARHREGKAPLPPFAEIFGMEAHEATPGTYSCSLPSSAWFSTATGTIYGGILAFAADAVMSGALGSALERDETLATLDLKVQFLRPVFPDGRALRAQAEVVHRGRSFASMQGRITNADGKAVVLAYSSAAIRSGKPWTSFAVADEASGIVGPPDDAHPTGS